jgi:beta-galactosidase
MRIVFFFAICAIACAPAAAQRVVTSLDSDWRFINRDANAAQEPEFNDFTWRKLDVPHDWSIEGPFAQANPSGGAGGFVPDGIGWYRKHFSLADADSAKHFSVVLDSVMSNSDVWINGIFLGHRPYGYVELNYELTGHLNFGADKTNILAVRVDQERQPASRYYMGAGILGHVRLVATDALHFEHNSVFVSTPQIDAAHAVVHVAGTIVMQSDKQGDTLSQATVGITLTDPDGQPVTPTSLPTSQMIGVQLGKSVAYSQDVTISAPRLWSLDSPQLYTAHVQINSISGSSDSEDVPFGIRTIKFTPATGFSLNGKNIRIQGVCLHADCSAFGAAVPTGAWERRLLGLKQFGVNAVRTAHNPPSPEFLNACDRLGVLVMDEMFDCWDVGKNKYDYHLYFDQWSLTDLRDTVRRDRNHPSIILYSAGNEIHDTPNAAASIRILTGLVNEFHANDPTRPVTQALLRPNESHDYTDGLADLLDVVGTNYRNSELLAAQQAKPTRTLIGTENHLEDVEFLAHNPPLSGIFIWAGVDYIGESFRFPQYTAGAGLLDRTDMPKASAYQVATVWLDKPFVHIVRGMAGGRGGFGRGGLGRGGRGRATLPATPPPGGDAPAPGAPGAFGGAGGFGGLPGFGRGPTPDWTPANLQPHPETVTVYSNCPKVELTLNGTPIPSGPMTPTGARTYTVTFAPGVLKAVGSDATGKPVATEDLHTAGPAAKIILTADKETLPNDWDDVSFIRASVVDADGLTVPSAADEITFATTGPGTVVAVDSADGSNTESFQARSRKAYAGTCFAIIKSSASNGQITVTATAKGVANGTVTLDATPAADAH